MTLSDWDEYELVKLIELRYRLAQMVPEEQHEAVAQLSEVFGKYRISQNMGGAASDNNDRGVERIRVALAAVEYVFSHGLLGIPTDSELLSDLVQLYENDGEKFDRLLAEANERLGIPADELAATDEWDNYELALLIAAYEKLSNMPQDAWDDFMENLAARLRGYQKSKKGKGRRYLETVADKVFMLSLLYAGTDWEEAGATQSEWEIFSLCKNNRTDFDKLLAEAEKKIAGDELDKK